MSDLSKGQKKFNDLKNKVIAMEADFIKFYDNNNAAAGTRIRKEMQDLKVIAQTIRTEVTEIKNNQ